MVILTTVLNQMLSPVPSIPLVLLGRYRDDDEAEGGSVHGSDASGTAAIEAGGGGGDGKGGGAAQTVRCEHCGRPFRKERVAKHQDGCKKKLRAIGAVRSLPKLGVRLGTKGVVVFSRLTGKVCTLNTIAIARLAVVSPRFSWVSDASHRFMFRAGRYLFTAR